MSTIDYRTQLRTQQASLPTPTGNATYGPARANRYGELYTTNSLQSRWNHALEGSYFCAHNTTNDAATTLAGHAAPVLADADATLTKPFVFVRNPSSSTSPTLIMLDYIRITVVTAGAAGTTASWAAQIDNGATRASGGTALTIVNPNMQSTAQSVLDTSGALLGGVITASAETSNCRVLGFGDIRPTIEVAGDVKLFTFGSDHRGGGSDGAAAAKRESVIPLPPVVLGPTDSFLLALYAPSQSAAGVYKLELGWCERAA
jgi:hypothetical protein